MDSSAAGVYEGIERYLMDAQTTDRERWKFINVSLPCIIDRILDIDSLIPLEGLGICPHGTGNFLRGIREYACDFTFTDRVVELNRTLVASFIACGFLCLFPKCQKHSSFRLHSINFNHFFQSEWSVLLPSSIYQLCYSVLFFSRSPPFVKLKCILGYFEKLAEDPGGPVGKLRFIRTVRCLSFPKFLCQ
jgi:hypothetical protein